jgi:nitroreductase/YHS domain-containing protein
MDILELIKRRRSIPKFLADPVPRETIDRMLEAATWAPNHHLTEPWEFIVLEGASRDRFAAIRRDFRLTLFPDPTAPGTLRAAEKIYRDTAGTPVIVVVTLHRSRDPDVAADDFAATFCAVQNMLLVAAADGIGTYPRTGGLIHDRALRAFLSLPPDQDVVAIIYVGYPAVVPERTRTPYAQKTRWMVDAGAPPPAPSVSAPSERGETVDNGAVAIDPVCRMEVDTATAQYTSDYRGRTYYFCAPGCKAAFDADPSEYAATPGTSDAR